MSVDQPKQRSISLRIDFVKKMNLRIRMLGESMGIVRAPGLDLPEDIGGSNWLTADMLELFRHAGRLNLNLRDVVGARSWSTFGKSNSEYAKQS